jgi:membrane associated rhomboid family serine protease
MANVIIEDIKAQLKSTNPVTRLIVINATVFVIISVFRILATVGILSSFVSLFLDNLSFHISLRGIIYKPWTIITYMFTHIELFHIFWNMITLFWFGNILSEYTSSKKIIPLYILGGIAGAIFTTLLFTLLPAFTNYVGAPMVGASAGVTAIIIAAAVLVPNVQLKLMFIGAVKLIYVALFVVFLDLLNVASNSNIGGSLAHLGGALMGYVFMVQYKKGNDLSKGINVLLGWLANLFKPSSKSKLKTVHRRFVPDEEYNSNKRAKQEQIDAILDKISKSGYESLSSKEKEFLFKVSNKE